MGPETVGDRIERLAKAKGLPVGGALAADLGVSYETLRRWKAGETAPNRNRAARIAEYLGCAPETFMHGVSDTAPNKLPPEEARLVEAFRTLLRDDKAELLAEVERRAKVVAEIEERFRAERSTRSTETQPAVESVDPASGVVQLPLTAQQLRGSDVFRQITSPFRKRDTAHADKPATKKGKP